MSELKETNEIKKGSHKSNIILMLYLMAKFNQDDNKCIFFPISIEPGFKYKISSINTVRWLCYFGFCDFEYNQISKSYIDDMCNYKSEFIVMPLTLNSVIIDEDNSIIDEDNLDKIQYKKIGHSNMLIYNKTLNELERFEPHGKTSRTTERLYNNQLLDEKLLQFAKEKIDENCTYVSPMNYCLDVGIQAEIEREVKINNEDKQLIGLCTIWTFIYANERLKYPEKSRDEIVRMISDNKGHYKNQALEIIKFIKEAYISLSSTRTEEEIYTVLQNLLTKYII
jgi:hypothetical protein